MSNNQINEIGFAASVTNKEIIDNDYSFVPARYVGTIKKIIDHEKIELEIETLSLEFDKLLDEFNNLIPKAKQSIKIFFHTNIIKIINNLNFYFKLLVYFYTNL